MSNYEQNIGAHDAERAYDISISVPDGEIPKSLEIYEKIDGELTGSVILYALDRIELSEYEGFKKVVYRIEVSHS